MKVWTVTKYNNEDPIDAEYATCGVCVNKDTAINWASQQILEQKIDEAELSVVETADGQVDVCAETDDEEEAWGYIIKEMEVIE